jgi:hypothetical protein
VLALGREGAQGRDLGGGEEVLGDLVGVRAAPGVLDVDAELGAAAGDGDGDQAVGVREVEVEVAEAVVGVDVGAAPLVVGEAPVAAIDRGVAGEGAAHEGAGDQELVAVAVEEEAGLAGALLGVHPRGVGGEQLRVADRSGVVSHTWTSPGASWIGSATRARSQAGPAAVKSHASGCRHGRGGAPWRASPMPSSSPFSSKPGVLLVNLGTPDAPQAAEVRRYLREFLSDPRVLDISPIGRWLLLNLIILPTRPAKSAEAYRKIWGADGSPLLSHSRALCERVRAALPELEVELAMRYGKPSIRAGLTALRDRGCDRIVVFPLYPQYAASSTGSTVEAVYREAAGLWNTPYLSVVPPFYDDPGFITAFAEVGAPVLAEFEPDHVLYSFHGLPERHMHKSDVSGSHCLRSETLLRGDRGGQSPLLPGPVPRDGGGADGEAGARSGGDVDQLSVAPRTRGVDPSVHGHRAAGAGPPRGQAGGGVLPGVRGGLPGDARGDRDAGRGGLQGGRRRGAATGAELERSPGVGAVGGGAGARGGATRAELAHREVSSGAAFTGP